MCTLGFAGMGPKTASIPLLPSSSLLPPASAFCSYKVNSAWYVREALSPWPKPGALLGGEDSYRVEGRVDEDGKTL